jgi:hypothetical protein
MVYSLIGQQRIQRSFSLDVGNCLYHEHDEISDWGIFYVFMRSVELDIALNHFSR